MDLIQVTSLLLIFLCGAKEQVCMEVIPQGVWYFSFG